MIVIMPYFSKRSNTNEDEFTTYFG
jgi:hypothetical protein